MNIRPKLTEDVDRRVRLNSREILISLMVSAAALLVWLATKSSDTATSQLIDPPTALPPGETIPVKTE
jgi:hypothetical protein